jgi:hypothetical protein
MLEDIPHRWKTPGFIVGVSSASAAIYPAFSNRPSGDHQRDLPGRLRNPRRDAPLRTGP